MTTINPQLVQKLGEIVANLDVLIFQLRAFYLSTKLSFAGGLFIVANASAAGTIRGIKNLARQYTRGVIRPTINTKFVDRQTWANNFTNIRSELAALASTLGVPPAIITAELRLIDFWYNRNILPYINVKK